MTPERIAHIRELYRNHPIVQELCTEIERLKMPEPVIDDDTLHLNGNSPSASPAPKKASRASKDATSGYTVPLCFANVDGFTAALAGWIEARRKRRNPPTGRAIQLLIDRLARRPGSAIAALDMCTERGWATIQWEWFDKEHPQTNGKYSPTQQFRGVSL